MGIDPFAEFHVSPGKEEGLAGSRESRQSSITDVPGVSVGHLTLAEGEVQTGVTVILPYPLAVRNRKLFIGSFAGNNWNEWTGLHVAQDFGTFSSPIVLCNATAVGTAYDALITFGHQRHFELPIDNAWPPIVIGVDDGYLNNLRERRLTGEQVLATIHAAAPAPACGSVGIGRGLCAFGGKGGVGEAARSLVVADEQLIVGALLVANGGRFLHQCEAELPSSLTPSFVLILATSAPLLPQQLRQLAEAGMRGLDRLGLCLQNEQRLALAFSTTNTVDGAFEEKLQLFRERWYGAETIALLCQAAAEAATQALQRALQQTEVITGRKGRQLRPVDLTHLVVE